MNVDELIGEDEPVSEEDRKMNAQVELALSRRRLDFYKPYPKQQLFHELGGVYGVTDRLLIAANQVGKTLSAAAELGMHVTGQYPAWWKGHRFVCENTWWAAGTTSQATRDTVQRMLLGRGENEWGTGMLPGRNIVKIKKAVHGVSEAVETVIVRHDVTKKDSIIVFKTYDQGRERWQGETLDGVWYDEEPPIEIYTEGKTRLQVRGGISMMTFTPLQGMSDVVLRFLKEKPPGSVSMTMTIDDALHYTKEQREKIVAGYLPHEREARSKGIPVMGSGRVFPIDEELIKCVPIVIPYFWPRIAGLDIGWDHPTAVVWYAWDRDTDTIYVYDCHRLREQTPLVHAAAINARGPWIPVAWPHDGLQHDKGSGKAIANQYRTHGCNMLRDHATHPPKIGEKEGSGGFGVEAGVMEMLDRMQTGRYKVFNNLNDWFEEFRMYYRKDGLIDPKGDDLMSASRVASMMIRHAKTKVTRNEAPDLPPQTPSDRTMGMLG